VIALRQKGLTLMEGLVDTQQATRMLGYSSCRMLPVQLDMWGLFIFIDCPMATPCQLMRCGLCLGILTYAP
jgi:hypothetical protein